MQDIEYWKKKKDGKVILDLGCGEFKHEGAIGIDAVKYGDVDIQYDLNKGIPFPDNSVDMIYAYHFLEHVERLKEFFIPEMYRVLKVGGIIKIEVPYYSSNLQYNTLDHISIFGYGTFNRYENAHKKHIQVKEIFRIRKRYLIWQIWTKFGAYNAIVIVPNFIVKKLSTNNLLLVGIYQKFFAWIFPCDVICFELEKE